MTKTSTVRVEVLVKIILQAGIQGCVCSPLEVSSLRRTYPLPFELITPGIRDKISALNDQKRVLTPSLAIAEGASRIVVGRPITMSDDPNLVFENFIKQLNPSNSFDQS